eukprot:2422709-Alexandrium_andersonii.AAC.1
MFPAHARRHRQMSASSCANWSSGSRPQADAPPLFILTTDLSGRLSLSCVGGGHLDVAMPE